MDFMQPWAISVAHPAMCNWPLRIFLRKMTILRKLFKNKTKSKNKNLCEYRPRNTYGFAVARDQNGKKYASDPALLLRHSHLPYSYL